MTESENNSRTHVQETMAGVQALLLGSPTGVASRVDGMGSENHSAESTLAKWSSLFEKVKVVAEAVKAVAEVRSLTR